MPRDSSAIARILSAFSPEKTNPEADPSVGAHVTTPDMALKAINQMMGDPEDGYKNVDEARADGYNIPQTPVYHDAQGNDITDKVNGWTPMQNRGIWGRLLNPEAASDEDRINNDYRSRASFANQQNRIKNSIGATNIGRALSAQGIPVNEQDPEDAIQSLEYMPQIESTEEKRAKLAAGIPSVAAGTELAQLNDQKERAISGQMETLMDRGAGNIGLGVQHRTAGYKSGIADFNRNLQLSPLKLRLGQDDLNNDILLSEEVTPQKIANEKVKATMLDPKVIANQVSQETSNVPARQALDLKQTQLASTETEGAIKRSASTEALRDKQVFNALNEAQTLTPAEQKLRLKTMGLSDKEATDAIRRYPQVKAAMDFKAKLEAVSAKDALSRYDDVKSATDSQAKIANIEGRGAIARLPDTELAKNFQAKVAAGKGRMVNGIYDSLADKAPAKSGVALSTGFVAKPKASVAAASTNAPAATTPQVGGSPAIKPVITNDVPPHGEVSENAPEVKAKAAIGASALTPVGDGLKDYKSIKDLPEDDYVAPQIEDKIFGSREQQAKQYIVQTLGPALAAQNKIYPMGHKNDSDAINALRAKAVAGQVGSIQDPKKLAAIIDMLDEMQGQTRHYSNKAY